MNFLKRAYLHTIRKKGNAFLLLSFLLVMSTLMLTYISIYFSADTAVQDVRKSLMGSFTINAKRIPSGLNESVIKEVLSIDGLTDNYNHRSYTQAVFRSANGNLMTIQTEGATDIPKGYEHAGKIVANLFSQKDNYFTEAGFQVMEGTAISPEHKQVVIVHADFATANQLSLGDYFILENVHRLFIKKV